MGRWRQRFARRDREAGSTSTFIGVFVAGLFVGLGVVCFVLDELPVHAGYMGGTTTIDGLRKDLFGFCFFATLS